MSKESPEQVSGSIFIDHYVACLAKRENERRAQRARKERLPCRGTFISNVCFKLKKFFLTVRFKPLLNHNHLPLSYDKGGSKKLDEQACPK